jgi:hypothetical protein
MRGPNPLRIAWSVADALRTTRRPAPTGSATVEHEELASVLDALRAGGVATLPDRRRQLAEYRKRLEQIEPDDLGRTGALAFWLNLYNAGALDLVAAAQADGASSVIRVPGGFTQEWATVAGERLSLDAIEHGKIRRFGDSRIHGALVCGSASCPTLRFEPYRGTDLETQLDAQMRGFLASGGAVVESDVLHLSRIFLWYGGDFVIPHRMPVFRPASRRSIARSLIPWLERTAAGLASSPGAVIRFRPYDWSLACTVR